MHTHIKQKSAKVWQRVSINGSAMSCSCVKAALMLSPADVKWHCCRQIAHISPIVRFPRPAWRRENTGTASHENRLALSPAFSGGARAQHSCQATDDVCVSPVWHVIVYLQRKCHENTFAILPRSFTIIIEDLHYYTIHTLWLVCI